MPTEPRPTTDAAERNCCDPPQRLREVLPYGCLTVGLQGEACVNYGL
jgi:hypothetical protein